MTFNAEKAAPAGRLLQNFDQPSKTDHNNHTQNTSGFQHVSSPMSRVLFGIAVKMVQRQYGVSAAHAATIVELSKMAEI